MDEQQRRYETATTMPMVEEEITPRNTDSLNVFAFLSAREGSKYLGLLSIGVGFAFVGFAYRILWLFLPAIAFTGFGVGGLLVLYQQLERYKDQPKTKTVRKYLYPEPKPQSNTVEPVFFDLQNGLPAQEIWQPQPAAFRAWLRSVLADNTRTQFSKNEAQKRGWGEEDYTVMVRRLRECGLLHKDQMFNGAPVLTDKGRTMARAWLER